MARSLSRDQAEVLLMSDDDIDDNSVSDDFLDATTASLKHAEEARQRAVELARRDSNAASGGNSVTPSLNSTQTPAPCVVHSDFREPSSSQERSYSQQHFQQQPPANSRLAQYRQARRQQHPQVPQSSSDGPRSTAVVPEVRENTENRNAANVSAPHDDHDEVGAAWDALMDDEEGLGDNKEGVASPEKRSTTPPPASAAAPADKKQKRMTTAELAAGPATLSPLDTTSNIGGTRAAEDEAHEDRGAFISPSTSTCETPVHLNAVMRQLHHRSATSGNHNKEVPPMTAQQMRHVSPPPPSATAAQSEIEPVTAQQAIATRPKPKPPLPYSAALLEAAESAGATDFNINALRERQALAHLEETNRLMIISDCDFKVMTLLSRLARDAATATVHLQRQVAEMGKRVVNAECELRAERKTKDTMQQQKLDSEAICAQDVIVLKEQLEAEQKSAETTRVALQDQFELSLKNIKDSYEDEAEHLRQQVVQLQDALASKERSMERREADAQRMAAEPAPVSLPERASPSPHRYRDDLLEVQSPQPKGIQAEKGSSPQGVDQHGARATSTTSVLSDDVYPLEEVAHAPRRGYLYLAMPGKKWRKMYCVLLQGTFAIAESEQSRLKPLFHMSHVTKAKATTARGQSGSFSYCFAVDHKPSPRSRVMTCEFACAEKHERHIWLETLKVSPQLQVKVGSNYYFETESVRSGFTTATAGRMSVASSTAPSRSSRPTASAGSRHHDVNQPLGYLMNDGTSTLSSRRTTAPTKVAAISGGGYSEESLHRWKEEHRVQKERHAVVEGLHTDIASKRGQQPQLSAAAREPLPLFSEKEGVVTGGLNKRRKAASVVKLPPGWDEDRR